MALRHFIIRQFGNPSGLWGSLAGWIMAHRDGNLRRIGWSVAILKARPGDHILELGFGPGIALQHLAGAVGPTGLVIGIDHSPVMLAQATRRNAAAITGRTVDLRLLDLSGLQFPHQLAQLHPRPFDKVFSSNVLGFVKDRMPLLNALFDALRPGGTIVTTYEPRMGAATQNARHFAETFIAELEAAGFVAPEVFELPLGKVNALCIAARRPSP